MLFSVCPLHCEVCEERGNFTLGMESVVHNKEEEELMCVKCADGYVLDLRTYICQGKGQGHCEGRGVEEEGVGLENFMKEVCVCVCVCVWVSVCVCVCVCVLVWLNE